MKNEHIHLRIIMLFFICTFIGTIGLWILDIAGILKNALLSRFSSNQYWGFFATDVVSMAILFLAIMGLKKHARWGLIVTHVAMGTWLYSSIGSLVMALLNSPKDMFVILWSPAYFCFAIYVIWVTRQLNFAQHSKRN